LVRGAAPFNPAAPAEVGIHVPVGVAYAIARVGRRRGCAPYIPPSGVIDYVKCGGMLAEGATGLRIFSDALFSAHLYHRVRGPDPRDVGGERERDEWRNDEMVGSYVRVHKGIVRGALLLMLAVGVLAGSGALQADGAQASNGLYRAIKNANLRTKPSKNGAILATVPKYAIVAALGPTKGCGAESCAWVKVAWDGYEGWSKGAYFEPALPIEGTAVADDNLNLRETPGYDGKVILVIPAGGEMTLTGKQSYPWVSVNYQGKKGWVFAEFLTVYPPPQY
jgi:uncharacterized protein YraI